MQIGVRNETRRQSEDLPHFSFSERCPRGPRGWDGAGGGPNLGGQPG